MTIAERNNKLKHFIACLKCEVSGKVCDDNCPTQYNAGNMGEIIENLETISKALEQEPKTGHWVEENINEWSRKVFCSECGCPPPFEYVNTGDVYSASGYGVINKTKYCPNCGAKMGK